MIDFSRPHARIAARWEANAAVSAWCEVLAGDPYPPSCSRTADAMLQFVVRAMRRLGYGVADSTDGESIILEDSTGDWLKLVFDSPTRRNGFDYAGSADDAEFIVGRWGSDA
jgi:hypothetical protein